MKELRQFLPHKNLRELSKNKTYFNEISEYFSKLNPDTFNLLHPYHNNSQSKYFDTLLLSNKKKNFNSIDLNDCFEFYFYSNKLLTENKSYIFVGDLENKKHSFCSGADLKYFYSLKKDSPNYNIYNNLAYLVVDQMYELTNKNIFNSIFIWNGVVMGGGLAPGIYSKLRIATESTILAMPETKFGFYPNITYPYFVSQFMTYSEALYFGLFSHKFNGIECFNLGLATNFILDKFVKNLINDLESIDKDNEKEVSQIINFYQEKSFLEINDQENIAYGKLESTLFIKNFINYSSSGTFAKVFNIQKDNNFDFNEEFISFDKQDFILNYKNYEKRNLNNSAKNILNLNYADYDYLNLYLRRLKQKETIKDKNIILDTEINLYLYNKFSRTLAKNLISFKDEQYFNQFYEKLSNDLLEGSMNKKNGLLRILYFHAMKELNQRSVLSLKQTHEITGKAYNGLTWEEYYDLDLEKSKESFDFEECFEGIRAFFIDKDNQPNWKFTSLTSLNNIHI